MNVLHLHHFIGELSSKPLLFSAIFFKLKKLKTFLGATAQGKNYHILTKFHTQEKENQLIPIPQT
jgi:hypothetical protein